MQPFLPLLLLSLGCKERPPEPAAERPAPTLVTRSPAPAAQSAPVESALPLPPEVASLRPLLLAEHPADLPNRKGLEAHPEAQTALRWMADNDALMLVRARSLDLLGLWDTEENAAFLATRAGDGALHVKQRTAAILGLSRMNLNQRTEAREALIGIAEGAEAACAVEAVGALAGVGTAREALEALAARQDLAPGVAEAIVRALN